MNTDKQAVKTIADAIMKAVQANIEQNNKTYVKNYSGSGSGGGTGGAYFSGTIPASRVIGFGTAVADYIIGLNGSQNPQAIATVNAINNIINVDVAKIGDLKAGIAEIFRLVADTAEIDNADINNLRTTIADIDNAHISNADIDYAQIKYLTTNTLFSRDTVTNKLHSDYLAITEANIVNLSVGNLMIADTNGKLVRITVDNEGNVVKDEDDNIVTGIVMFDGDDIIGAGEADEQGNYPGTLTGNAIRSGTITASRLDVQDIFATNAVIKQLIANNIDVNTLFGRTAFLNELQANIISSDLGENQSVISLMNDSINLVVTTDEATGELRLTDRVLEATTNSINLIADDIVFSANDSISAIVKNEVKNYIYYRMDIVSTSDILSDNVTSTVLSSKLYRGTEDYTNEAPAAGFIWTRISSDTVGDSNWNNNPIHKNVKSITVTRSDVKYNATFQCQYYLDGDINSNVVASASKGILDMSDGYSMTVSIGQNLPSTQVYDSNNYTYTPNWITNILILTPTVMVNRNVIDNTDQNLTITWKKRLGDGTESALGNGEMILDKALHISTNTLGNVTSGILTYVADVVYQNEDGSKLTGIGTATFSLLKTSKDTWVRIEGEQVFKYPAGATRPINQYIMLTAQNRGCNEFHWQYKASNGIWVASEQFPSHQEDMTAAVNEKYIYYDDEIFVNDVATIRVRTEYSDVYDIFSIYKIYDSVGEKGDTGDKGDSANIAFLTNENITFSGDKSGRVKATTTTCNVVGYTGLIKATPVVGSVIGAPAGMNIVVGSGNANYEVPITISITEGATLGGEGEQFGELIIPVTSPVQTNLTLTWSKVNTGATGEAAVLFSIYTPDGTTFTNGEGQLRLNAVGYHGAEEIVEDATYQWSKYSSGNWNDIAGATNSTYTVNGNTVSGIGIFRCTMAYGSEEYDAIVSLTDKTDNFQAIVSSTGGDIFKNGIGESELTCRLFQNGKEIDSTGNRYTYYWYLLNKDGESINWILYDELGYPTGDEAEYKTGKTIAVTGKDVDSKTTFVCEVDDQNLESTDRQITASQFTIVDLTDAIQSDTAPEDPIVGTLWIDTSKNPNRMMRFNGSEWVDVAAVDGEAIEATITTVSSNLIQNYDSTTINSIRNDVQTAQDDITGVRDQIAEINVRYDDISLVVASKSTNYRQTDEPENANTGDIWIKPTTIQGHDGIVEETYQATGVVGESLPEFAYNDDGYLLYTYVDGALEIADIVVDENGYLKVESTGEYSIDNSGMFNGTPEWKKIKGDGLAALEIQVGGIVSTVSDLNGNISTVSQQADKINWIVSSESTESEIELTDNMLSIISDNFEVMAESIDLSGNDTVHIYSGGQIEAAAIDDIVLAANNKIRLIVGDELSEHFEFAEDGLRIRNEGSKWYTRSGNDGFYIEHEDVVGHIGAFHGEVFEPRSIQMSEITVRPSGSGGWVWVDADQ